MAQKLITVMYRFTDASVNSDKFYEMKMVDKDHFVARWGRWGSKGLTRDYPMSEWQAVEQNKIDRKYVEIERKSETIIGDEYDSSEYDLD